MTPEAERWFAARSWQEPSWSVERLAPLKGRTRVSVVLPALNEQDTIAPIVTALAPLADPGGHRPPLVDEIVVLDSGSTDNTRERASRAGARVVSREDVLTEFEPRAGKGEVLWRSLAAVSGDVLVFLDSDLVDFDAGFVPALLGPLLTRPEPVLVKGFYRRPLRLPREGLQQAEGGGRVTELLARPVLSAVRPDLAGVIQPLGGEYAARREFLEAVPFAPGYGVETGLLIDAYDRHGLDGLAQVNLGVRKHRNRGLLQLGIMSRQILAAALSRTEEHPHPAEASGGSGAEVSYTQFVQLESEWVPHEQAIPTAERPPLRSLRESQAR
ncbi:glucosyl-3-phosphoglycerate synthase [Actinopolyspora erythraea]|uniref:Glucosyl-3-phosphoglycerate synthase n=1 Tax=Actinopolyspora erythraea TaxID=414996 RepID=A0A099D783_9ACTN|nr:glucosyl-3-phosphoglycerate synthase [Actinopolyspora erythraea]ASU78898.1 glucosyl-3-phosphoglycerate synthase [Actinopolyspora erythraea]KGI81245.1 glucosyl-3-phosphoglycerate synthase [Actinopolyspora erythraea]